MPNVPFSDLERHFVEPAVKGTLGILESAKKAPTVQRIVVTSSISSILPLPVLFGLQPQDQIYNAESRMPEMEPPYTNAIIAYTAGKIAALNRAERWMSEEHPQFDLIHIFPSFVYGRDDLCTSTDAFQTGTNRFPLNIALGQPDPMGIETMPNLYNHVDDCAAVHIMALEPGIRGNQGFIVSSTGDEGMKWDDTREIARQRFAQAVQDGRLLNDGGLNTTTVRVDNSKTEDTFNMKHASYAEMATSVIEHYLELLEYQNNNA